MPKSTAATPKFQKPDPLFPLFPHATNRWAKKVNGKFHYFGKVSTDPEGKAALQLWLDNRDAIKNGLPVQKPGEGFTIKDLSNHFLTAKQLAREAGEITARTWQDYFDTCAMLGKELGLTRRVSELTPGEFDKLRAKMAKLWGPVRLGNQVQRVRTVFKFGFDAALLDQPVRFGPMFKKPSKKVMRLERAKKGQRMLEPPDITKLLGAAGVQLRAMILLGINCGLGNSDLGNLPIRALDLKGGWLNFPRPKTGIPRRAKLWAKTLAALNAVLATRPTPKDEADKQLVFVTKYGQAWAKEIANSPISKEFRKLLDEVKLYRPGLSFYTLRHCFETVAGETKDQAAVDHVMGHAREDMASVYRERISDERLELVADRVHGWLFGESKGPR